MARVRINTPDSPECSAFYAHWLKRVDGRQLLRPMGKELAQWLLSSPEAPDLVEAPAGWHKRFISFTVCGEGKCLKTCYTIYQPGSFRRGSVDLDEWEARSHVAAVFGDENLE